MSENSRFIIGIDLGTTNCAVSYLDTWEKPISHIFRIPQLNGQKMVEALSLLPSFYYLAETEELKECTLPWEKTVKDFVIGSYAEKQGLKTPTRLISSAKSWLSNKTCDRKEKILPFDAFDPNKKISPVEASSAFLDHIRHAWNAQFAKNNPLFELEQQEVILTVPASFDEVARSLTIEAARGAGIPHFTLLEEPQAAFYSWLMDHEKNYASLFQQDDIILVCDVGGGTCDFSLIQVISESQEIEFRRMAVGPHLLLGGDNMDMAICHYIERVKQEELDNSQWLLLRFLAKSAKEFLLNASENMSYSLWVPGKGSKVVGGGFGVQLKSDEIKNMLAEGFFELCPFKKAISLKRGEALRSMGLNFEQDPSITKHLAHFLHKSGLKDKPKYLLFNGGALKPKLFQERIANAIDLWYSSGKPVQTLVSNSLDLAVARGAAYFGKVRRKEGIPISGGLPRAYYLKLESDHPEPVALTLCERGTKEGTEYISSSSFSLTANTPVSFQILHSHTRLGDKKEDLVPINEEEMSVLPPLSTVLKFGKEKDSLVPVKLKCKLTELGILEISLFSTITEHVWKLEFQLRNADKSEFFQERLLDEAIDEQLLERAQKEIQEAFAVGQQEKLKGIMSTLECILQKTKADWSPSVLRALFKTLMETSDKRFLAASYESRFWNLAGFFLRPGIGVPLDDYRLKEIWKLILTDLKKTSSEEVEIQKAILYRRISAGLKKGQQMQLFNEIFPLIYNQKRKNLIVNEKNGKYAFEEKLRAVASFELVDISLKQKLGEALLERILSGKGGSSEYWALGRIGARQLLYGGAQHVVSKDICEKWIMQLLTAPQAECEHLPFLLFLLSKKTDFREINLSQKHHDLVEKFLKEKGTNLSAHDHFSVKMEEKIFGDSLPQGLRII